jgi:hypothetical protein
MPDKTKRQAVMTQIIKDIYSDIYLTSLLVLREKQPRIFSLISRDFRENWILICFKIQRKIREGGF